MLCFHARVKFQSNQPTASDSWRLILKAGKQHAWGGLKSCASYKYRRAPSNCCVWRLRYIDKLFIITFGFTVLFDLYIVFFISRYQEVDYINVFLVTTLFLIYYGYIYVARHLPKRKFYALLAVLSLAFVGFLVLLHSFEIIGAWTLIIYSLVSLGFVPSIMYVNYFYERFFRG